MRDPGAVSYMPADWSRSMNWFVCTLTCHASLTVRLHSYSILHFPLHRSFEVKPLHFSSELCEDARAGNFTTPTHKERREGGIPSHSYLPPPHQSQESQRPQPASTSPPHKSYHQDDSRLGTQALPCSIQWRPEGGREA
jgi:hypothetical protein